MKRILSLVQNPYVVGDRHPNVPEQRRNAIITHLQGVSDPADYRHVLECFETNAGTPKAEILLVKELLGVEVTAEVSTPPPAAPKPAAKADK